MRRGWAVIGLLALAGCHAKFKREVGNIHAVHTQVIGAGVPEVMLGHVEGNSLAAAVVNVVQDVKAINVGDRIAGAVRPDDVAYRLQQGVADTLREGPPFAYTDQPKTAVLQLEIESYGLAVPYLGAPGVFTYDFRVRIYQPDGERVYKARMDCDAGAGAPEATEIVLGVVNNVREIKDMSDADINQAFGDIAYWCGTQLVAKMRRQAS